MGKVVVSEDLVAVSPNFAKWIKKRIAALAGAVSDSPLEPVTSWCISFVYPSGWFCAKWYADVRFLFSRR
jgi:hypothetical protein